MAEFDSDRRFVLKSVLGGMVFGVSAGTGMGASGTGTPDTPSMALWEDPEELVAAVSTDEVAETIANVEYRGEVEQVEVFEEELQEFPLEDDSYVVLSSGRAEEVPGDPETFVDSNMGGRTFDNYSPDDFDAYDVAELRIDIAVPDDAEGIAFDYKFGSDENPDFLGSDFQDFFEANLVRPGIGPTNIGLLPDGSPVTVDNANDFSNSPGGGSQSPSEPFPDPPDVTYNAVTELLTASGSLAGSGGDTVRLILRIGDASDEIYDSGVLLDNLRFTDDVEGSEIPVETALDDYETTVRWGIERYVRAVAERDAQLYAAHGDEYADDIVNYFGYEAGEVSADALDEEWLETIEAATEGLTTEQASALYEFFAGLFDTVTAGEAEVTPPEDVFFQYYWNEYPLHGPDGEAVRTYAELDESYGARFAERAESFRDEMETEEYSASEIDAITTYINARTEEHVESIQRTVDEIEAQTEVLVETEGETLNGQFDAIDIPPGVEDGGGGGEPHSAIVVGAYFLTHTAKGKAVLGAAKAAKAKAGTWVSSQASSHGVGVSLGSSAAASSAFALAHKISSFLVAVYHSKAFFVLDTAKALKHAWKLGVSTGEFIDGVVDDHREQTVDLAADGPQEAIEIAGRDVEITELTVEDVSSDHVIPSEEGLVGEGAGSVTVENTGSSAFVPVPEGTIIADTVIPDGLSHSTGYDVVLSEPVDELEPGASTTVDFTYAVPIDLLPTTYTLEISVIGHEVASSASFTAGISDLEGVTSETVAAGEITDGESTDETHAPATETETLSYELAYSQLDADLHLYDQAGNHTGVDYATDTMVNDVPGATHSGNDEGVHGSESIVVTDPGSEEYTVEVVAPEIDLIVQLDEDDAVPGVGAGPLSAAGAGIAGIESRSRPQLYSVTNGVNIEYEVDSTQIPDLPPSPAVSLDQSPPIVEHGDDVTVSVRVSEIGFNADATDLSASVSELTATDEDGVIEDVSVVDTDELDVPAGGSRTFEVDVSVPNDVPPDVYTGTVSVSDADGDVEADGTVRVQFPVDEAEAAATDDEGLPFGLSLPEVAAGGAVSAGMLYLAVRTLSENESS